MVTDSINNKEFNTKVRNMLWLGLPCYLGFCIGMYFSFNRSDSVIWVSLITALILFLNAGIIGLESLNLNPKKGTSYFMAAHFLITMISVVVASDLTGWPAGSFVAVLIISLALMEVSFIFSDLLRRIVFLLVFIAGLNVFLVAPDALGLRLQFAIGFSMLSAWRFINLFYLKKFLNSYANEIKQEAYLNYMGTVKHELNNTGTILLGLSRFMRKKKANSLEDDLEKLDQSIYRMLNQINTIDHFDGMNKLYDEHTENFQNLH